MSETFGNYILFARLDIILAAGNYIITSLLHAVTEKTSISGGLAEYPRNGNYYSPVTEKAQKNRLQLTQQARRQK